MKTEDEFFRLLGLSRDSLWVKDKTGAIRHPLHYCPWIAVARQRPDAVRKNPRHMVDAFGDALLAAVAKACDNAEGHDPALRQRLTETLL